ncbi:flavin monoamine oxidase family protein [Planktotalea sp.]|uniref:flavin monoamine oxidase family protein n=1 Tax=Planktotalea sp. TaxID=2029877 RepID=UPI003F6C4980
MSNRTLIIGGGLSGLALADMLERNGHDYLLLDARPRFGGRIKTQHIGDGSFDMGPAWFWSGQPKMAALIQRFGLKTFEQYATGDLIFEDERGQVQRGAGLSSMAGSWRVSGGLSALIDALVEQIPQSKRALNSEVSALSYDGSKIRARFRGETSSFDKVVFAMPPRLAAQVTFEPPLPDSARSAMANVPTWMAGQAKAVAVYDTAFWREAGLSGDAMSRRGPMVEIHDASPKTAGPYALFGFIGVSPRDRADEHALRGHIIAQLVRLFGEVAAEPKALFIKDWAFDPRTATQADQAPMYAHPTYGSPRNLSGLWDGHLIFSGTEVADQFGGYLEGALHAADRTFNLLSDA